MSSGPQKEVYDTTLGEVTEHAVDTTAYITAIDLSAKPGWYTITADQDLLVRVGGSDVATVAETERTNAPGSDFAVADVVANNGQEAFHIRAGQTNQAFLTARVLTGGAAGSMRLRRRFVKTS